MPSRKEIFHWRPEGEKAFGYAQAVRAGDTVYISGCMSVDESFSVIAPGDMAAQLRNVYEAMKTTLEHFDLTFQNVVEEVVYVTDMPALIEQNEIRKSYYEGVEPPATTALAVAGLAFEGQVVEVKAVAVVD